MYVKNKFYLQVDYIGLNKRHSYIEWYLVKGRFLFCKSLILCVYYTREQVNPLILIKCFQRRML